MKIFTNALFTSLFTFLTIFAVAQNGEYDVRFDLHSIDCNTNKAYIHIEVRANAAGAEFNLADQNYRFSFNRNAIVPGSAVIDTMHMAGFIGTSLYDPHTLTGSVDTVVSYNAVLAGGTGELISTNWVTIGRIAFDIIDIDQCIELEWHDHSPTMFPPTFIGEKFAGVLYEVDEALYLNNSICPAPECNALPVELAGFEGTEENCSIVLDWKTLTETNNESFLLERSYDGETFEVIATIKGAGNSNQPLNYTYTDNRVSSNNYYRLSQVDFDGTVTVFKTINLKSSCYDEGTTFTMAEVYPNPVNAGPVFIKFHTTIEVANAQIVVTDALGRTVAVETTAIEAGPNTLSFQTDQLASGTYFVQVKSDNWRTKGRKFVKIAK